MTAAAAAAANATGAGAGEKKNSTPDVRSAVAQSVESATPSEVVLGSIPAAATRPLLVGSVSV